jgi:hypothetical protein
MIRDPDPDLDFQSIPDPGSRIQGSKRHRIQGPRSRIRIRSTVIDRVKRSQNKDRQMKKMFSIQKLETMYIKKLVLIKLYRCKHAGPITQSYFFVFSIAIVTVEELSAIFRPGLNKDFFLVFGIFL